MSLAGCASADPKKTIPSGNFSGVTDQHLRLRAAVGADQVRLTMRLMCSVSGAGYYSSEPRMLSLDRDLVADLASDGTFRGREKFVVGGTDGDEHRLTVEVVGTVRSTGVTGEVNATEALYNGQLGRVDGRCRAKRVAFEANERTSLIATSGDIPISEAEVLVSASGGLVVLDEMSGVASHDSRLTLVDAAGAVRGTAAVGPQGYPTHNAYARTVVTAEGRTAWVISGSLAHAAIESALHRYDLVTGERVAERVVGAIGLGSSSGRLWASVHDQSGFSLHELDAATGATVRSTPLRFGGSVAVDSTAVYVVGEHQTLITDRETMAVEEVVDLRGTGFKVVAAPRGVWIWGGGRKVHYLSPDGNSETINLTSYVTGVAPDGTGAWVSLSEQQLLVRIDGSKISGFFDLEHAVTDIAYDGTGQLWGAGRDAVYRLDLPTTALP